jgi:hypothetical protein
MAEKKYTLVYNNGDLDIQIAYDTLDEIKKFVEARGFEYDDYCIIDGFPVKTFANKLFPVK